MRSLDMHGEVAIAESEPGLAAEAAYRLHEIPAFAGAAPAAFHVGKTAEGIDDDGEVGADGPFQSQRKLGAADAAAQRDHGPAAKGGCAARAHRNISRSRGRISAEALRAGASNVR